MADPTLDLSWIPLGAGARVVRTSERLYERAIATWQHRAPRYPVAIRPTGASWGRARSGAAGGTA